MQNTFTRQEKQSGKSWEQRAKSQMGLRKRNSGHNLKLTNVTDIKKGIHIKLVDTLLSVPLI